MKTNESCPWRAEAFHPSGGLANTGSALNNHDYLRSSVADCFFQDHPFGGLANTGSILNIRVYLRSSAAGCFFQDLRSCPGATSPWRRWARPGWLRNSPLPASGVCIRCISLKARPWPPPHRLGGGGGRVSVGG